MVATVERLSSDQNVRQANCAACLSLDCALSGNAESPVTLCNSFREANCALCATRDCPMNGQLNSPVMACGSFVPFGAKDS
ncbi:hypothetical protein PN462_12645 [Spirulina sp. CS-785/01]|uniref:hypothetical protein n=1 Tax=Spirulina sp. CS-785/01 TaxID=3021716 RepID=UPI00232AC831|nr:hypothetical protein [Spirulina sp. CS-785/01]MDB9313953.1 hypothetical protein [Spirulina sp. CS-785/01]